jgi:hypothetical protein
MEYDGDPGFDGVDGQWIVDGPNSGGVKFYVLWRGHLFLVEQEFSYGTVGRGIPAEAFAAAHRGSDDVRYRWIVADLDARGLSSPSGGRQ